MDSQRLAQEIGTLLQADETLRAYLLIDPMCHAPLDDATIDAAELDRWEIAVRRPGIAAGQRPWLLTLRPGAVEVLQASVAAAVSELGHPELESTRGFAVGGWLTSAAPGDVLARHFAEVMSPMEPRHGLRYLRWADRRVTEWMWPALDPDQRAALMGPVEQWLTLDRRGAVVRYQRPEVTPVAPMPGMPRLLLSDAQWAHAHRCEAVQQMLRGWRAFDDALPADYLQQADRAVACARALGLQESADIVLLGAYQLMLHPCLCDHPRIAQAVRHAREQGMPLNVALAEIPDPEGWDAIRRELERSLVPA